jgi:hypothetical protein
VTAQDPPTLRLVDIARLLNVTSERARRLADRERCGFPAPVVTRPRRSWSRDDVEAWIDEVDWWGAKPWRTPRAPGWREA